MENIVCNEVSETNRGKKQIVIDRKYKFNFSYRMVDNTNKYRCTHYKTDYKCKSFVIINDKNEVIKYYNKHNHLEENHNAESRVFRKKICRTGYLPLYSLFIFYNYFSLKKKRLNVNMASKSNKLY